MKTLRSTAAMVALTLVSAVAASVAADPSGEPSLVLHAARLLDVAGGRILSPGEVLVSGEKILAVSGSVDRPAGRVVKPLDSARR